MRQRVGEVPLTTAKSTPVIVAFVRLAFVSIALGSEALERFAPLRLALVNVATPNDALLRFCPLRFAPVKSSPKARPAQVFYRIVGSAG